METDLGSRLTGLAGVFLLAAIHTVATAASLTEVAPPVSVTCGFSANGGPAADCRAASVVCPYAAVAAAHGIPDDGCRGAPAGLPQFPHALDRYGRRRPPWDVAGVDYPVGLPSGTPLRDWTTIDDANCRADVATALVGCYGTGVETISGVDFSTDVGGSIYIPNGGIRSLTVTNSNFGCGSGHGGDYLLLSQNTAMITLSNNTFSGVNCTNNQTSLIGISGGTTILQYNIFEYSGQHVIEQSGRSNVIYQHNTIYRIAMNPGAHKNYMQWGTIGAGSTATVEFNFSYEDKPLPGGGEGFQFYPNNALVGLSTAIFANNTMVSLMVAGHGTMSYMVHGGIVGSGRNSNNYFDATGSFGAYYPRSMTSALGWTTSGNTDMNTGGTITPQ